MSWLCIALLWCPSAAIPNDDPVEQGPPELLCGVENVEDLVAIPNSRWIIGSGLGDATFQSGALHLIDARATTAKQLVPELRPDLVAEPPYAGCPAPPDAAFFSAHGLSLRSSVDGTYELFVVNHGGRESVEVFRVTPSFREPTFDWIGCIIAPPTAHSINAVAAGASGRLLLSATAANGRGTPEQLFAGENTGAVYSWEAEAGWAEIVDSALPGNNGIVLADDERGVFVAAWAAASVTYIPLVADAPARSTIELDFFPDNIRRAFDGKLAVTGQVASLEDVSTCVAADDRHCAIDYRAALIDPTSLTVTTLYDGDGTEAFGLATVALQTERALWLGSARTECIAKVVLK
ncbi:MAG: hypothetical protein ABW321_30110 [Polyangiales bacterium]